MKFNEKQTNVINDFIMRYNADEDFAKSVQQLYGDNLHKLSILQIYALEEVLRYGTKGIFARFLAVKNTSPIDKAVELFDEFIRLFNAEPYFKEQKMEQLKTAVETLSPMEMLAITIISNSNEHKQKMHDEMTEELEYDPCNPILYSTDNEIKETLLNLFLGEFILEVLEHPSMKPAKVRQKKSGMIANIDKPIIIENVRGAVLDPSFRSQLTQIINARFVKAKMQVLLGRGKLAFEEYLKFNTNISSREILGIEKDYNDTENNNFTKK